MQANLEDQREEHLMHVGQLMQRSMERLRWDFRRVADWERDQAVTKIDEIHGPAFVRHMNTADKFASEWSPILGASHRTIKLADLSKEFKQFVRIPRERELSTGDNEHMMGPITEAEILAAIAALNRHKAAGPDGLNNDFYKDTQALMVPALERVCNGIMNGDEMPPSFLEALIIPLRKKGDSADAMDYRPISLLQTSYKIFAKVLATQLQAILPRLIGHSQQGFVHGRQMQKTVMMMLAQLLTAEDEMNVDADSSRIIPLLDFKNAYDTVDREFIYETLRAFGFNEAFIDLMRRMHTDTSASFLVNGEQSKARAVESGIRQGCPLAPLLFLLAAEILGLAIQQNPDLTGLPVPSLEGVRHIFSAFVDDSTVFLERATQLKRTMELVRRFGALSGLHVQPTKSQIIFLNTAIQLREYGGIAVLQHSDTVRYLGYEVETGQLTNKNWVARIRKIQRRLATATRIATNVENRVLILNAIVLPSILFTAAVFEMPAWAEKEICNITKQFLWKHATGTEVSRNKVNPGLLVTPKKAGGVGLASFTIAIKTQYIKHAIQWPLQRQDAYFAAWRTWAYRGVSPDIARHPSENKLLANQNRFR
ncbi:hypothetical protein PR003_g5465 [Phytophthora rubi]|uniref:Reverse transcriptase domain-containing protein n=1 Tax=Phytophthora rubi TaxID=129364 RepID=A0A6A4FSC4_9STRA|nr:hypothetical protein PR001_g10695 [Phytophthora rubi]KAE9350239.1 hypothetical protein PR003_g5465 [Phytophthora rubi]